MTHTRRLLLVVTIALAALVAGQGHAGAATASCQITVPAVHAQADGSGTITDHAKGSCTFAWHSKNLIQFKDRWHTLGVEEHPGGAAGVYVVQSRDSDNYHGDGYWRVVMLIYDRHDVLRFRLVGPVTEFAS